MISYCLRNSQTGKYLGVHTSAYIHSRPSYIETDIIDCLKFDCIEDAQNARKYRKEFDEIRKVKVEDTGELV